MEVRAPFHPSPFWKLKSWSPLSSSAPFWLCHQPKLSSDLFKLEEWRIPYPASLFSHLCPLLSIGILLASHPSHPLRNRKPGFLMPWGPALASRLRRSITDRSQARQPFTEETHQADSCRSFLTQSFGEDRWPGWGRCPVLHGCFDMPGQASNTTTTFMNLLHSHASWPLSHSLILSTDPLASDLGLTHFPVYNLASALIPNVLHSFSGNDLCFPLD